MKNSVMGYAVSASKMMWKQRYISDDQWEQLYWEFLNCCFLVWKHPIQSAAFLIWGPRLIKMVMFFYPLMITTILFLLIRFSLGPQLERMRVDRDIQWNRFKEAAVGDEDVSGGSWRYQKPCGKLKISKQVNRNIAKGGGDSVELTESLEEVDRPIVFTEKEHRDTIEINDMNVDFRKGTEEEVEQDAGPIGVSGKSLILGKVRELMERLIDELGGRVELDALNALESITQILMESTGRDYQNGSKYCHPFTTVKFECDLSDDEQFQKTVCDEDCKLTRPFSDTLKSENIDDSRDDVKEGKNPIFLAKLETEHQKPDCRQSHTTSYVLESHCFTRLEINCQTVDLETAAGSKNEQDQGKNSILLTREDALSDDAQATGHVADLEFTTDSENAGETFKKQDNTAPSHQCREWGESLDINEANLSGSQDVGTGSPVQDREDWVEGLSDLGHCELRSCRSLSIEALKNDFRWMGPSLEIEKGNGLKQIFSNKCNRDQREHHHLLPFSVRNQQQNSKQPCVLAGKLKSCPSEPITFVKKTQLSASPVMRLETEEMDLLWEQYNDVSQGQLSARKEPIPDLDSDLSGIVDSDIEDQKEASQVCCLQAFKLSKGRMPLRKPNLKKISKALKKLALFQNFRGRKTAQI